MVQTDLKLEKFETAVLKAAQEQADKIRASLVNKKEEAIRRTKEKELARHFSDMQAQVAKINRENAKEISACRQEAKKRLLVLRNDICQRVFSAVEEKLSAFSKTEEYKDFMKKLYEKERPPFPEDATVHVREADIELAKVLFSDSQVCPYDGIKLGGFILKSESARIAADCTLEGRLFLQREYFYEICGLEL